MDRQSFREELCNALQHKLLEVVQNYIDKRFDKLEQSVKYIAASDRKYEGTNVIKEGFPGIFKNIKDGLTGDIDVFLQLYSAAIDEIIDPVPDRVVWPQREERFVVQDNDSLVMTIVKKGKRTARSISSLFLNAVRGFKAIFRSNVSKPEPWKQTIFLKKVVWFHLYDEQFIQPLLHEIERTQLGLIIDFEDHLVVSATGGLTLANFVERQNNELETRRKELKGAATDAIDDLETVIFSEIEKTGTFEKGNSFYNETRLEARQGQFEETLKNNLGQWQNIQHLFFERTKDVAEFLSLRDDIRNEIQKFKQAFRIIFEKDLEEPFKELIRTLDENAQDAGKDKFLNDVYKLKALLDDFVKDRMIDPVQKLVDKQIVTQKIEHFFEDILLLGGQSPQVAMLIFDYDLEKNPPTVDQKEVQWRQLVLRALREQFINDLKPEKQNYEEFLSAIFNDIREVENIISINLESALEVHEETESPRRVAQRALERISGIANELHARASEKWADIEQHLEEGEEKISASLLNLLHKGDSKELQILNAKYRVKETTNDWRSVLDARWAAIQDRVMLWTRFLGKKGNQYFVSTKDYLGFKDEKVEEAKQADIATYLSETNQKMRELPYIYRRFFDFHSLADKRFNVSSQETEQTFKKAFEKWQQQLPATVAVLGEKGSGKSSFINLMTGSHLADEEVITIEFKETIWTEEVLVTKMANTFGIKESSTIDEIIGALEKSEHRRVVVVESIQNCFVRNINGYDAIEKLCYLISETHGNIFWIASCSRYAWAFLDKAIQLSEYFSHVAESDDLNAQQIKSVIINRHRASGYLLNFEPDGEIVKSRDYRKLVDQEDKAQEHLQEEFFENLAKLAEGNASIAIIFWIRSIHEFDDTHFYIKPLEVTMLEMVEDLSPRVLFALAAFIIHDTLIDKDLSMILNISEQESRLLINRLQSRSLIEQKNSAFTINHLMYRQIVLLLKERNIIHLV